MESILSSLVAIFACTPIVDLTDPTTSPSTTNNAITAASEGISIDTTKTIGLLPLLTILKPYFWPEGLYNRICVLFTWIFLVVGKVANIAAPLFIAKATDDLASNHGLETTEHIVIYTLLLFANKALKEA